VVPARDWPEHRLKRGDIVKPVEHHVAPNRTEGCSAEVFNALGDTLVVITVADSALERLTFSSRQRVASHNQVASLSSHA